MADSDELIIEIEGDAPDVGKVVTIEGDKPERTERKPDDDAVAGFKKQLVDAQTARDAEKTRADDEARRRTEAEAEAARLRDDNTKARGETVDSQLDAVTNAINAATSEGDAAERDYAAAMEEGNFKAAAVAQRKMSDASARLVRLGDSKFDLEEAKKTPPRQEQRREAQPGNPVDQFIATRTTQTQTWLRSHPDVAESMVRGGNLGVIATGAHAEAERRGIKPDTDEYFQLIETRLGLREEKKAETKPEQDQDPAHKRKPMQSAPMSREVNSNGNGSGGQQVTLSKGEQASATDGTVVWTKNDKLVRDGKAVAGQPIGVQEYARRKYSMKQQGYYDRAAVE